MEDLSAERTPPSGDRRYELFVRLLLEHQTSVRSFLRGLLPSWEDVDEVAQEASLVAWRKFSDFEDGTSFGGWLLTIARFEALKHRRRHARSRLVFSDELWELLADEAEDEAQSVRWTFRRQCLERCLAKLDSAKRELLLKAHTQGAVIKNMAMQSGKSEQAFYKTIQRLRVVLLNCVSKAVAAEDA